MRVRQKNFQIIRVVILAVLVDVMRLFSRQEAPAEFLLRHQTVLVGVSADIRQVVILTDADQHITMLCD